MADIIFWKPSDFRGTLYSKVFELTGIQNGIQNGGHNIL